MQTPGDRAEYSVKYQVNVQHLNRRFLEMITKNLNESEFIDLRPSLTSYFDYYDKIEKTYGTGKLSVRPEQSSENVAETTPVESAPWRKPVSEAAQSKGDSEHMPKTTFQFVSSTPKVVGVTAPISAATSKTVDNVDKAPKFSFSDGGKNTTASTVAPTFSFGTSKPATSMPVPSFSAPTTKESVDKPISSSALKASTSNAAPAPTFSFGSTTTAKPIAATAPSFSSTAKDPAPSKPSFSFGATPTAPSLSKPAAAAPAFGSSNFQFSFGAKPAENAPAPLFGSLVAPTSQPSTSGGNNDGENKNGSEDEDEDEIKEEVIDDVEEPGAHFSMEIDLLYNHPQENALKDKGRCFIFLKKLDNNKLQIIIRAKTKLKTLYLNVLSSSCRITPCKKKSVFLITKPDPPIQGIDGPVQFILKCFDENERKQLLENLTPSS